jgi:hypothetical protein
MRRARKFIASAAVAVGLGAGLAACGSTTTVLQAPKPTAPQIQQFNPQAITVQQCTALARWEVTADGTAMYNPQVQAIVSAAAGTPFGADQSTWVDDIDNSAPGQETEDDADQVITDCNAAGVPNVLSGG